MLAGFSVMRQNSGPASIPNNIHFGGTMSFRLARFFLPFALLFSAVCVMTAAAPRAQAQNVYATIHGTVTDNSGAVIPNAQVE